MTVRLIPPATAEFLIFLPKITFSLFAHRRVGTAVNRESKSNLINEITYLSFGLQIDLPSNQLNLLSYKMLPPVIKTRVTLLVKLMERGKEQTLLQISVLKSSL